MRCPDEIAAGANVRRSGVSRLLRALSGTPPSEDSRSVANTASPDPEPLTLMERCADTLWGLVVPADDDVVCDGGGFCSEHDLLTSNASDDPMDIVEQWVRSGTFSDQHGDDCSCRSLSDPGGGARGPGAEICFRLSSGPSHGGYPDPSRTNDWNAYALDPHKKQSYPCSHSVCGRRTDNNSSRVFRAPSAGAASSSPQQQLERQEQKQQPSCNPGKACAAGRLPHGACLHGVSNRSKLRNAIETRISRRLRVMDFQKAASALMRS